MIHRILVALDESPRAPAVFQRGVELARGRDVELILFRAVASPQEFPAAGAGTPADPLAPNLTRAAERDLRMYAATEPELSSRVVVRLELSPDRAVLAASEELDVDLIVIGNHGYSGLDRILGTTAIRVLHGAKRDVLIVFRGAHHAH
ncbi:MAG TPA: universal stress protein [Polyangiaceae bacterium]|nr:universal stress protein [Polyangiaceae bacterium]